MKSPLFIGALVCAVLVAGCSSFEAEWREAGKAPPSSDLMSGRWLGFWQNTNNDHHEALRAILTPTGSNTWSAFFHARYGGVLTFTIRTPLAGEPESDRMRFHGEKDLGVLAGGIYRFAGYATATNFFSTYLSAYNSGEFHMTRSATELESGKGAPARP